jgi:hypothetical protein
VTTNVVKPAVGNAFTDVTVSDRFWQVDQGNDIKLKASAIIPTEAFFASVLCLSNWAITLIQSLIDMVISNGCTVEHSKRSKADARAFCAWIPATRGTSFGKAPASTSF